MFLPLALMPVAFVPAVMVPLAMFGQTLDNKDWAVIGLLVVLEGVLSIDNALVLGLLAKRLPKRMQSRALTYGLVGAFVFRLIAIATAAYLLKWRIVKLFGGGYLVYIAVKHLFFEHSEKEEKHVVATAEGVPALVGKGGRPLSPQQEDLEIKERTPLPVPERCTDEEIAAGDCPDPAQVRATGAGLPATTPAALAEKPVATPAETAAAAAANWKFWKTVFVIEMTDIAFAIDSILAAIALVGSAPAGHVGPHPKLWVVISGGMLGVILMRFAAVMFIKLLERFPRFETAAYLLVIVIGGKLLADWGFNSEQHPHRIDFHSTHSWAFWAFWVLMLVCFCIGFLPKKRDDQETPVGPPATA